MAALSRRDFCKTSATTTGAVAAGMAMSGPLLLQAGESPNETVRIGVMGCSGKGKGRGANLARQLSTLQNVEIVTVCDVDSRNVDPVVEAVSSNQKTKAKGTDDYRRIIEDDAIDAMVVATPDHWHAPAAIAGIAAGKHVYVEKPCCHNPQEGQWLVEAARKHKRVVQHGTQRRSWPAVQEAMQKLKEGAIGDVLTARCWYFNDRPTIGTGSTTAPPEWLNWKLWQGPAPEADFRSNLVHYNWHWFWDYGTAEVGNNGVHFIDICRWGLGVDFADRVTSGGGRYRYDDDQQTPDTNVCSFHFGEKAIIWEGRSWGGRLPYDAPYDFAFYGTKGLLAVRKGYYKIYDLNDEVVAESKGADGDMDHLNNFVDSVRGDAKPNAEIEEGYKTALLCNLANIAYRTGSTVDFDGDSQKITNNDPAMNLWSRDYRDGMKPTF